MTRRCLMALAALVAVFLVLPASAQAFRHESMREVPPPAAASASPSMFVDSGYGKKWLGDFFPYELPQAGDVHAVLGDMLNIYNTGVLVLASVLALWSIIGMVVDSARTGEVGGGRHSMVYGPLRLVIAIGLLVPLSHGYNAAQIIIVQLAHTGSGLANNVWQKFTPYSADTNLSLPVSQGEIVSDLLQKALVDETCFASVLLDKIPGPAGPPSVTIQAFYPDPDRPGHEVEGMENPLSSKASDSGADAMKADAAITTESETRAQPVSRLRIHYNRTGFDDYCGAINLPVPAVPGGRIVVPQDQTLYADPFLQVRSELGAYGQSMASAVQALMTPPAKAGAQGAGGAAASPAAAGSSTPVVLPQVAGSTAGPGAGASLAASAAKELPQASMSAQAWDQLVGEVESSMASSAERAARDYLATTASGETMKPATDDWVAAGSLFFKLTKLSHDNVRLRHEPVAATLPDPAVLPAEMRSDGRLASCAPVLNNWFLADYACRTDGQRAMLTIKVAYNLIHSVESQRGTDTVPAIDGAFETSRKEETLTSRLFADSGLGGVMAELTTIATPNPALKHSAMFDVVNVGNMLFLSSSGLFAQSAGLGQIPGEMSQSMLLTLFAMLLLVPAVFLGIVLPLLPAIRFFIGIAAWLLTVFEALVAFPMVVLGNLRTDGEGLLAHGRQGYLLLLQMVLRPVLMVFGLMAALFVFEGLYGFVTWVIWSALLDIQSGSAALSGSGIQGVLELTGYVFLWCAMIYIAANIAFRAITAVPDNMLKWLSEASFSGSVRSEPAIASSPGGTSVRMAAAPVITQEAIIERRTAAQIGQSPAPVTTGDGAPLPPKNRNVDHIPRIREPNTPETTLTGPVPQIGSGRSGNASHIVGGGSPDGRAERREPGNAGSPSAAEGTGEGRSGASLQTDGPIGRDRSRSGDVDMPDS